MCLTNLSKSQNLTLNNRIFKAGAKFPKEGSFYTAYSPLNGSFFQKQDPKEAMAHRSLYSSHMSRESVRRAEPLVKTLCTKLFRVLQATAEDQTNTVNLSMGFRALASDVIMSFTSNKPLGALDSPGFNFAVTRALTDETISGQWAAYFPGVFGILFKAVDRLPFWLVEKSMGPLALSKFLLKVRSPCSTHLIL